jgi:hypothetical protein
MGQGIFMATDTITRSSNAYPYASPARRCDEDGYNPAAHGGCAYIETHPDGRRRRLVNVNQGHEEVGPWR